MLDRAADLDKLRIIQWSFSFRETYTLFGGIIGGALLSAASHGTDHLIVQRLLATTSLSDARRALIGSGILVIFQFGLFLIVGTAIWAAGAADPAMSGDEIFPFFAVNYLPSGLSGLVIAGLLAAAMSTLASSLNSLASATTHDFYAPLSGRSDQQHLLGVGRWATVLWAVVLGVLALSFAGSSDTPVVELALSIASITYGSLLGTYILGGVARSVGQRDAIIAIAVASATMLTLFLIKPGPFAALAWPWYVPLGTAITIATGWISSRLGSPR
jgi:Na+/proline symporter